MARRLARTNNCAHGIPGWGVAAHRGFDEEAVTALIAVARRDLEKERVQ
jgi:hypothetical protein